MHHQTLRLLLVLLCTSFLGASAYASLPDSILQKIKRPTPEEEVGELISLARYYSRTSTVEFAQVLAEEGLKRAKALKNDSLILKAKFILGSCYEDHGYYRLAAKTYEKGLTLSKEKGTLEDQSQFLNAIGICYDYLGKYNEAIEVYLEAQKINEKLGYEKDMAYVLINIGLIRFNQKNYQEAESTFLRALEIGEKLDDDDVRALVWSNLGMLENERNDLDKTLYYQQKTLEVDLSHDPINPNWVGSDYSSIGEVWMKKGNPDSALFYLLKGLEVKKISMAHRSLVTSHIQIAEFYLSRNKWDLANAHLDSAKSIGHDLEDPAIRLETMRVDARYLVAIGRGIEASALYENYIELSDSLQQAQNYAAGKLLEEEFDLEIRARDLLDMETQLLDEKEKSRSIRIILILLFVLFASLVWLYILNIRKRRELSSKQDQLDKALAELQKRNEEIILKNEALEDALSAKTRFLSVISHEIRTPLHVIMGLANSLKEECKDPAHKQSIEILYDSTLQLIQLVNEVLDLNKLEHGSVKLKLLPFSFSQMLSTLRGAYTVECKRKNIGFEMAVGEGLPEYLLADRIKIEQVVNNLLNNAIKFTENGQVKLEVKLLEENQDQVRIEMKVLDSGIGIPEKDQEKIFNPFYQADGDTSRNYGGTGLGLTITKALIELMQGTISLKSTPGQGTEITLVLPLKKAKDPQNREIVGRSTWMWPEGKTLLVAEDHPQNQMLLKMMLNKIGASATWTNNGAECLKAALEQKYDVILLDMHMPVMDGYEAAQHLRKKFGNSVYLMGLTAANSDEVHEKAESLFDSMLFKPYPQEKLYLLLEEAVDK
ncbi:MAG: ATP-binding protein [Bacteroidia bacterium]